MKDPLALMTQRIQRYWYVDGLAEIGMGVLFSVIGLIYLAATRLSTPSLGWILIIGQVVVILSSAWLVGRGVRAIKERLTYPRTGYIAYPPKKGKDRILRIVISGGIAVVVSTLVGLVSRLPSLNSWLPLISGALIALAMLFIGFRFDLTHFFLLAAYDVAAGWGVSRAGLEDDQKFAVLFCLLGVGLFVSGGVTLLRYLRSTRPADSREE